MFTGPVFIVGRPRSGTKLLRSLLNGHPEISIPFWESNFIPKYLDKEKGFGDLSDPKNFSLFFDSFRKIEFFRMIKKNPAYSQIVNKEKWFNAIECFSYSGIIEAFYKMYAQCDHKSVWGDKSPHYMLNIQLLKDLFPKCKFIHIIRDVRDHCLSNMKAWKKNPYRSAQMWVDAIHKCRTDAAFYLGKDYHELKYEALLDNPERELKKICDFLCVKYKETMAVLGRPAENLGDTRDTKEIVKSNKDKWRSEMPDGMIEKIEKISFDLLHELNYDVIFAKSSGSLKPFEMSITRVADAWNRFRFDCWFQGGLAKGIIYQCRKRRYG